MSRLLAGLLTFGLIVAGCGVLPGTGSGGSSTQAGDTTTAGTPVVFPTTAPTSTPTPAPTPTRAPTVTPLPEPTPTPSVNDSYTGLVESVRAIFSAPDIEAAIAEIVPVPIPMAIPPDAVLEQVELEYGQFSKWGQITGGFPPIDTPARVAISVSFLTAANIETLREVFISAFEDAGYLMVSDNSSPGQFADVSFELNGGSFSRGKDGEGRLNALQQGETNFVQLEMDVELDQDTQPSIIDWPLIFPMPFSGGFVEYSASGRTGSDGIEVSSSADWLIGVRVSDVTGVLETMAAEYPSGALTVGEGVTESPTSETSVVTFRHVTGSSGSIAAFVSSEGTNLDIIAVSMPG
ncbi:MAG: hypothetical protein ACR2PK_18770 [Acidimicrobiales bacterium]